jgi:hypothetical protein
MQLSPAHLGSGMQGPKGHTYDIFVRDLILERSLVFFNPRDVHPDSVYQSSCCFHGRPRKTNRHPTNQTLMHAAMLEIFACMGNGRVEEAPPQPRQTPFLAGPAKLSTEKD